MGGLCPTYNSFHRLDGELLERYKNSKKCCYGYKQAEFIINAQMQTIPGSLKIVSRDRLSFCNKKNGLDGVVRSKFDMSMLELTKGFMGKTQRILMKVLTPPPSSF